VQPVPVFRRFHAEPYYQLFTDMPGFDWQFELSLWQKNLRAGFKLSSLDRSGKHFGRDLRVRFAELRKQTTWTTSNSALIANWRQ
jgi:hypothetical protein